MKIDSQKYMNRQLRKEWENTKEDFRERLYRRYQMSFRNKFEESQEDWGRCLKENPFPDFEEWLKNEDLLQDD